MLSRTLGALAAASLLSVGSVAGAQSATARPGPGGSAAIERAGGETEDSNQLRGAGRWIVGAVALALLIWGIIELTSNNEEAFPNSP